jgi:hypothetical protein
MTPCYTFLGIFYLNNAEFTDGNFFDVFYRTVMKSYSGYFIILIINSVL